MKKDILFIAVIASVFLVSCNGYNGKKLRGSEKEDKTAAIIDNLIQSAITDSTGSILEMSFDNEDNSAFFVFNGEIIEMKSDTVASGIKYSNAHYEYREWQGEIMLKKDDQVVFSYKKPEKVKN